MTDNEKRSPPCVVIRWTTRGAAYWSCKTGCQKETSKVQSGLDKSPGRYINPYRNAKFASDFFRGEFGVFHYALIIHSPIDKIRRMVVPETCNLYLSEATLFRQMPVDDLPHIRGPPLCSIRFYKKSD